MLKIPDVAVERVRSTFVIDAQRVEVPEWVANLESFRHWARSDEFPESGRICFLDGEVWVDMSMEQIFTHNQVKTEFTRVLSNIAKTRRLGRHFSDGVRVSNEQANLSCQPDGCFVSFKSRSLGRIRTIAGAQEGVVELEGTPDMVLEVISASSVGKDTQRLRQLYWKAGVPEYWLVDARGERLTFEILRHSQKGYVATRKMSGWLKSTVFGQSLRLRQTTDENGDPEFTLDVK